MKTRVHDELWMDNDTGEVMTATQAIREFYKTAHALADWTAHYTFIGQYSTEVLEVPDFKKAAALR